MKSQSNGNENAKLIVKGHNLEKIHNNGVLCGFKYSHIEGAQATTDILNENPDEEKITATVLKRLGFFKDAGAWYLTLADNLPPYDRFYYDEHYHMVCLGLKSG